MFTKKEATKDDSSGSSQDTRLGAAHSQHAKVANEGFVGRMYETVVTFFLMQVLALLYKNALLFRRNVVGTLVHVFAPGLMIVIFGLIVNSSSGSATEPRHPKTITTLGSSASGDLGLPMCQVLDVVGGRFGAGKPMSNAACVSMIYAPATDAGVNRVIEVLAKRNGLKSQIVGATDALGNVMDSVVSDQSVDILGFTDTTRMAAFLAENSAYGRVGFALRFGDNGLVSRINDTLFDERDMDGIADPTIAYQIWTNNTFDNRDLNEFRYRMNINDGPATVIQRAVNEAIIGAHTGDDEAELRVGLKAFPRVTGPAVGEEIDEDYSSDGNMLTVEAFLPIFLYVGVMFSFIMTLRHIVQEKQSKILDGLRMMGLTESAYWVSWLAYYAVLMFISTWFVIAAGHAFAVPMFVHSDTWLMFWCIYLYFLSMVCFAMFLSTLVPTVCISNVFVFVFVYVLCLSIFSLFYCFVLTSCLCCCCYPLDRELLVRTHRLWMKSTRLTSSNSPPPNTYTQTFMAMIVGMVFFLAFFILSFMTTLPLFHSAFLYNPWTIDPALRDFATLFPPVMFSTLNKLMYAYTRPYEVKKFDVVKNRTVSALEHGRFDWELMQGGSYEYLDPQRAQGDVLNVYNRSGICQIYNPDDACNTYSTSAGWNENQSPEENTARAIRTPCTWRWFEAMSEGQNKGACEAAGASYFTGVDPYNEQAGPVAICMCDWTVPPAEQMLAKFALLPLIYTALAWIFGQILTYGHGRAQPIWFMLMPWYWLPRFISKPAFLQGGKAPTQPQTMSGDSDVASEASSVERVAQGHGSPNHVVVKNIVKEFSSVCGLGKTTRAVDGVSLSLEPGKVFALLGHNGAGKTTCLNMILGLTSVSGGDCKINGLSVVDNISALRGHISACPQHDILWSQLSSVEHLRFYGLFQGMPMSEINRQASSLLDKVRLGSVKHNRAGSYSGGMKRRLSVVIAALGEFLVFILLVGGGSGSLCVKWNGGLLA
jgi:ABC-type lipoprotein export system ATPase subunit